MSSKVLVTGGTGFLGAYIIKELVEKGYAVKAIRRERSRMPFYISSSILEKVEWIEGDILDVIFLEEAMEDVDTVIHSAAVVSFSPKNRHEMYQVNVEGTANVVNIALEQNIRRLVYISSVAALGRTLQGQSVSEMSKWENNKSNTHYAKSKHKAELEVWRAIGEGLDAVILNPATILGYGDWNTGSSAIFKSVYKGFDWYSPGKNGFVAVEDVARATVLLMETDITEQRFIIAGDNWTFKQLLDTMAEGFGRPHPKKQTTPSMMGIAWRWEKIKSFFTGHSPVLTKESAKVAHSNTTFENAKILQTLQGFRFTPLNEAIDHACKKYLAQVSSKTN
ncbi:SDR family NAD(P)-dependent oxidoreductase [Terrimonas sp. NA20]|uniref:SDR family NAD(P)-dependent oxidoreductase n=1 Tax=Terrimonas ginsenosidimutans TaxID=2908004 RepID=A0ABS9KZ08_9BACT|nr:SDR family NAD(P)-dependent oxidoreductase [Terrimonas ginsenosidimutans]MCG2617617.1 SDR family NAD(P)-dependent oxidoreductase [Terrimonas ginsenosidimutans]